MEIWRPASAPRLDESRPVRVLSHHSLQFIAVSEKNFCAPACGTGTRSIAMFVREVSRAFRVS
jgi:hypothetical protein